MRRILKFKDTQIEYILERKKVKNINLRIRRDGLISVSAHECVPLCVIDGFVLQNAEKILMAKKKLSELPVHTFSLEDKSKIYILGRGYDLRLFEGNKNFAAVEKNTVILRVRGSELYENRLAAYDFLLTDTAKRVFPMIFEECCARFFGESKTPPELRIRKMTSQWGNCYHGRNIVTLNSRLAAYDEEIIRSVIYHELCHFVYPNHSKDFYKLLTEVSPNWKECKEKLKPTKYALF